MSEPAVLASAAPVVIAARNAAAAEPTHPNFFVRHWLLALSAAALLVVGSIGGWIAARRLTQTPQPSEARLTNNPPDDPIMSVALSPDAKYLAFADRAGLFLRELATGETHSIDIPGVVRPRARAWFPDGSHLLVNAAQATGVMSVYNVPLLGGSARKIVENADARSISPDGSQIAVVRNDWPQQEVWIFSSDGQNSRQLIAPTGDIFGAIVWSPHGRKLAFVRYKYGFSHHESENSLEIHDLQTNQTHVVLSNTALADSLVWSPDGRLIYSLQEQTSGPSIKSGDGDSNFWAMSIDENSGQPFGAARRLTSGLERKMSPSLSADGKHLAFLRWNGEAHVYFSEVEPGARRIGAPQRLSLEEGRNYPYGWTADGKSILFYIRSRGSVSIVSTAHRSAGARPTRGRERCDYDRAAESRRHAGLLSRCGARRKRPEPNAAHARSDVGWRAAAYFSARDDRQFSVRNFAGEALHFWNRDIARKSICAV